MFSIKTFHKVLKAASTSLLLAFIFSASPASAIMMKQNELTVTNRGMVATAEFTLNTPCSPYTLNWGDGEVVTQSEQKDMVCIQVLAAVSQQHTYQTAGEYNVTFVQNNRTSSQIVLVPTEVSKFNLADVQSVTSLWVDPSELIADEEYFLYTITLKNGEVLTVKTAGFTTKEFIKEQFKAAGYTGEVAALTALAKPVVTQTPKPTPEEVESETKISLQKKVITLLKQLISLLGLR